MSDAIFLPTKIRRLEGKTELYLVEDYQGKPLAYTHNERLARMVFAAPGMMDALDNLSKTIQILVSQQKETSKQEAMESAAESLKDAHTAMRAALKTEIV